MGSAIRILLVTPLLGLLAAVGILATQASPAFAWSIVAECDENGMVAGEIEIPEAGTFDIYVADHVPGQGYWVEIPGSRQSITVVSGKEGFVSYGPLNIENIREDANSIRVEQTATPEKSDSFKPCLTVPIPTNTSTATSTRTTEPTRTSTPVVSTSTRTARPDHPDQPTRTPTLVPPKATRTTVSVVGPPSVKTPAIQLPETGTGGEGGFNQGETIFMIVSATLIGIILLVIVGGLVFLQRRYPN